jgi:hypothetical protein
MRRWLETENDLFVPSLSWQIKASLCLVLIVEETNEKKGTD